MMIPEDKPLNPAVAVGHNSPRDMRADALALLREELHKVPVEGDKTFEQRRDEIIHAATKATIKDRPTLGDAGDIICIANDVKKLIDERRMAQSKPFRDTADALKGEVDEFWYEVDEALDALRVRMREFTEAEDERIAAQQREQDEMMARMRPAAAPATPAPSRTQPARRTRARGELGAVVSQVERKVYTVVDVRALPDLVLNSPAVTEAIIGVARGLAKFMPEIPGIKVDITTDNSVR